MKLDSANILEASICTVALDSNNSFAEEVVYLTVSLDAYGSSSPHGF
jgi:hypothetical protein